MMDGRIISLGGSRVTSRVQTPIRWHVRHDDLTDLNRSIAESIPFWPRKITAKEIAGKVGMHPGSVMTRLSTFQDRYLIFQDGFEFSRLKEDLSNLDEAGYGEEPPRRSVR
jgi:hypothetical protein